MSHNGPTTSVEHSQTMILERNLSGHRSIQTLRAAAAATSTGDALLSGNPSLVPTTGFFPRLCTSTREAASEESPLLGRSDDDQFHEHDDSPRPSRSVSGNSIPTLLEYYTNGFSKDSLRPVSGNHGFALDDTHHNTIRFQVVWWHVGQVDMVQGRVPVTFRVTLFWNTNPNHGNHEMETDVTETQSQYGGSQKTNASSKFRMVGRQQAILQPQPVPMEKGGETVDVPAVSILNVATFDTIGDPEVSVLRDDETEGGTLMRWSCMYRATLNQEHWQVHNFPHDSHEISLRLAILAHRQPGAVWDRTVWRLGLATPDDSQGSVRIPHGLVVAAVQIPEFQYNAAQGLSFEFQPLDHGSGVSSDASRCDTCLHVTLRVVRNSSYYDRNIMPLLGLLNFVAVSITALDDVDFFQRALLTLNIAFVEIGMRMTADSKLPTASYQIKMQRILNEYFFGLLFLVLESLLVYELQRFGIHHTGWIDGCAALAVFSHNTWTLCAYYSDAQRAQSAMFGSRNSDTSGVMHTLRR